MGALIKCSVDKKDYVISISVDDQDPLICATIADTVRARLQQFITEYRTSKARTDLEYYQKMCKDAKEKYERYVVLMEVIPTLTRTLSWSHLN